MVLAGGVGLGAYQAGAYQALHGAGRSADWIAASSVGAVNAAVIAGSPTDECIERLRRLWSTDDPPFLINQSLWGAWPHVHNWMSVLRGRLFGVPGHFHPRLSLPGGPFVSFYDLAPMRARLERLVDFERVHAADIRLTIATTDIETGESVLFDNTKGDKITADHILASCGFLPEFAPVEIGNRLLGDGGLSANAPIDAVLLDEQRPDEFLCFIVDLYAGDGTRPANLEEAMARKSDLIFANQTRQRLDAHRREAGLRARIARLSEQLPPAVRKRGEIAECLHGQEDKAVVLHLSYRPDPEEAGPERPFDLSPRSVSTRWRAGALDMQEALATLSQLPKEGGIVRSIRRAASEMPDIGLRSGTSGRRR
ncbi:patatin-like phospholipase family protein [Xanthobacteraceae bacterium Astr-EGSB]|uniref:patatin-like phospholipase family protein n=1 Tax=Astrobacterium formosum TaxID=3069710 RepID=UPI0027B1663D|nr:patatin-like phospholipase family protein [Xanthobacteraceae bacterium Astr-EGSB]